MKEIFMLVLILGFFFSPIWFFCLRKDFATSKIEKTVQKEALKGNRFAIAILERISSINYKNIPVILEDLNGNPNAIEILGLRISQEKK